MSAPVKLLPGLGREAEMRKIVDELSSAMGTSTDETLDLLDQLTDDGVFDRNTLALDFERAKAELGTKTAKFLRSWWPL